MPWMLRTSPSFPTLGNRIDGLTSPFRKKGSFPRIKKMQCIKIGILFFFPQWRYRVHKQRQKPTSHHRDEKGPRQLAWGSREAPQTVVVDFPRSGQEDVGATLRVSGKERKGQQGRCPGGQCPKQEGPAPTHAPGEGLSAGRSSLWPGPGRK